MTKLEQIQTILGVKADNIWGKRSQAALDALIEVEEPRPAVQANILTHDGLASSFANPADIRAFKRCKAGGGTDMECFQVGDNAIGCWGDSTAQGTGPSCAIPPDDMIARFGKVNSARHARVIVTANGKTATVLVKDRMPWKRNIKNGAVIDLNPDAAKALGLHPPFLVKASWKWA